MAGPGGRLRVLVLGPSLDREDVGESYSAGRLVEALSEAAEVTILALQRAGRTPLAGQYPLARVVTWPEPAFLSRRLERLNAIAKPALPLFFARARRWLAAERARGAPVFDIAHQVMPQAMRYASPLRSGPLPYVIGPLGGSLATPAAFRAEMGRVPLLTRLRVLDRWRLRHDPALRASYANAALVLGVAPYIGEMLREAGIAVRRFEPFLERASEPLPPMPGRAADPGALRLLHVGRAVRTKGLRDVVRALARLPDLPEVTLTSAGEGEDLPHARAEAERLGVAGRIRFLGRRPRAEIETLYASHDVFCFPSFREPMGGVLFEAMRWGLPVITAAAGGPDYIVDASCGIKLVPGTPAQFAGDIAGAIRRLAGDVALRRELGEGARARLESFGGWEAKARRLTGFYREVLGPA
jgi:glycosyltransferase involved in cell wall biosynthesis